MAYILFLKKKPFEYNTRKDLYNQINKQNFTSIKHEIPEIKSLVELLTLQCRSLDAISLLESQVFKDFNTFKSEDFKFNTILEEISKNKKSDRLMNFLIIFSGTNDNSTYLNELRNVFCQMDTNKDGILSENELEEGLTIFLNSREKAKARVKEIFNEADSNQDKALDMNEFLIISYRVDKATVNKMRHKVTEIYERLDSDGSKEISLSEFITSIGISKVDNPVI